MYLPNDNAHMADILSELITYARATGQASLAEALSDAMIVLASAPKRPGEGQLSRAAPETPA